MHEESQTDRCICKDIEKQCLIKYISFSYIIILLSENAFVLTIHEESNTIIFFLSEQSVCYTVESLINKILTNKNGNYKGGSRLCAFQAKKLAGGDYT